MPDEVYEDNLRKVAEKLHYAITIEEALRGLRQLGQVTLYVEGDTRYTLQNIVDPLEELQRKSPEGEAVEVGETPAWSSYKIYFTRINDIRSRVAGLYTAEPDHDAIRTSPPGGF